MLRIDAICLAGGICQFYWLLEKIPPAAADGGDALAARPGAPRAGYLLHARRARKK